MLAAVKDFSTRLRLLIIAYREQRGEITALRNTISEREEEIARLKGLLKETESKYEALLTAKMLSLTDLDVENVQKRIVKLLRTVEKCITLLSSEK